MKEEAGCCTDQAVEKPNFIHLFWDFMRTDEPATKFLERVWDMGAAHRLNELDEAIRLRDYWYKLCLDRTDDLNKKHEDLKKVEGFYSEAVAQKNDLIRENERISKNTDYWNKEWNKIKHELNELGKSLSYKQELSEDLAHKLDAAYKREAALKDQLDRIDYIEESIDALERMINLLKYNPQKCCS